MVNLAVGSHCSLLAVVNFTASIDCWQLKSHCKQSLLATACRENSLLPTASSEKSLLPTASSEQSLLLLPIVTSVCVHARACMCAEVYMYHWTCNLSTCMPFSNVLTEKLNPFRREKWTFTAATADSDRCVPVRVCARVHACVLKYTYTIQPARFLHACRFITSLHKSLWKATVTVATVSNFHSEWLIK